jgi:hypothetical protein
MKALFLGLLLVNVFYFAWARWHSPGETQLVATPAVEAPTLQLAREAANPASESAEPASGTSGDAGAEMLAPQAEPAESAEQVTAATSGTRDGELLTSVVRCVSIGPFRDLAEATQASATLRVGGYDPRTRVAEGDVWAGLWVYLDDLPSHEEAQRAMTLLKRRGISDAYIMPSADLTNDISLGVFSEPARAQRRAEEIRALGFTPTIADRTRRGTVYWIDLDLKPTDGIINPAELQSESGRIVRLEVLACPSETAPGAG